MAVGEIKTIETTPFKFNIERVNPLFSRSKIYVMYHGENRNGSSISKEAVEKSLHTLKNTPIVGEFVKKNGEGNFKGHGGEIVLSDDGIEYVHTTFPIGLIPESATITWEIIKDRKKIDREYLVVDGALLWNRYEDQVLTLKEDNFGQSMELEVVDGEYDDENDIYNINEFAFSALCVLGIEKDGDGHVEPAFEDAKIITYNLDKEKFKKEFSTMLGELKFSLTQEEPIVEGDDNMFKELLEKYSLTEEDLKEKGIDFADISEEELEAKIVEAFETEKETETKEDKVDFEAKIADLEAKLSASEEKAVGLTKEVSTLTQEVETLRDFKVNAEKEKHASDAQEMFDKFELTEDEVKEIDVHNLSIKEIEEKCYAVLGRKFSKKENFSSKNGVHIQLNHKEDDGAEPSPYGDLFSGLK